MRQQPAKLAARSDDEIIDAIREAVGFEKGDPRIETLIRTKIGAIQVVKSDRPVGGSRKVNKAYAKQMRAWLDAGVDLFKAAPSPFILTLLFASEPLKSPKAMNESATSRMLAFDGFLTNLRKHCDWVERAGIHENKDYMQERAATASSQLMMECGLPLAWSSSTSPYRTVACLLYEAAIGIEAPGEEQLKRACKAIAAFYDLWVSRRGKQI
jgi:hypothetical protein